jgi:hypothetical protein
MKKKRFASYRMTYPVRRDHLRVEVVRLESLSLESVAFIGIPILSITAVFPVIRYAYVCFNI